MPSFASLLLTIVAKIMVLPNLTTTEPSACLANLPVSNEMIRPSPISKLCVVPICDIFFVLCFDVFETDLY